MFYDDGSTTEDDRARATRFVHELKALCLKHKIDIVHEDCHGSFILNILPKNYSGHYEKFLANDFDSAQLNLVTPEPDREYLRA